MWKGEKIRKKKTRPPPTMKDVNNSRALVIHMCWMCMYDIDRIQDSL